MRKALLLLALVGICVAIKRSIQRGARRHKDHEAEAQWANEGGANAPPTV